MIFYFPQPGPCKPLGAIFLTDGSAVKFLCYFEVRPEDLGKDKPNGFVICSIGRDFKCSAPSPEDRDLWIGALNVLSCLPLARD